jgi:hypothetical protein
MRPQVLLIYVDVDQVFEFAVPTENPQTGLHDQVSSCGYKLVDDAWRSAGRLTYLHDDELTRAHIKELEQVLRPLGWDVSGNGPGAEVISAIIPDG